MITVVSDTHSTEGHALTGRTLDAVRAADLVLHAGDFTTVDALEAFRDVADRLLAVHGNADEMAVRDRLPSERTVEADGLRIALTHRRDGGATGLSLFGRSRDADLVISGHTHRPSFADGDVALLNPGSHADPRGNRPGHAELERTDEGVRGELRQPDGSLIRAFTVEVE